MSRPQPRDHTGDPAAGMNTDAAVATRPSGRARWEGLRDTLTLYAVVALGTAIGSVLRALASVAAIALLGPGFPWGTL